MNGDSENNEKEKDTSVAGANSITNGAQSGNVEGAQQNGESGYNPPDGDPLKTFYEDVSKVMDVPEYEKFQKKLTEDRAARKTFFEDVKESGRVEGLPDSFSKFESKLFRVEPSPKEQSDGFQAGDDIPDYPENVFSSIMGFKEEVEQEAAERERAKERQKEMNSGLNVRFNIRRNKKIREFENQVDDLSAEYEALREQAAENPMEVEGAGGTIRVPDPTLRNKAQRVKEKRDQAAEQLSKVKQTIYDEMDTGQAAGESAVNTYISGTLSALSEDVLKAGSNVIQLMKPFVRDVQPGMNPLTTLTRDPERKIKEAAQEDPTETELYQAGEQVGSWIQDTFPENPKFQRDFWIKTMPQAAGFATATMAGGGAGRAIGAAGGAGGAIIGSASLATNEFENALRRTGDREKAFETFIWNLPVGASEGLLPGRFFARLNKGTGGAAAKTMEEWVETQGKHLAAKTTADKAKAVAGDFLKGGTEEFFQETFQNYMTNVGAQNIYDKTRELFDNVMTEGAAGFLIGSFLNGAGRVLAQSREDASAREREEIRKAEQFINEQQQKLVNGELPVTAQQEQAAGERQVQPQIDFSFDPNAPLEQQIEKLKSERAKLNDQASELEGDDPAVADYDMAVAQIDDLIREKQSELQGEQGETGEGGQAQDQPAQGEAAENVEEIDQGGQVDTDRPIHEQYAQSQGIDPDNLHWMGEGEFGEAYATDEGEIIKITSSESEAELAQRRMGEENPAFANVTDVKKSGDQYIIRQEELETGGDIEDGFNAAQQVLQDQGLSPAEAHYFDPDEMSDDVRPVYEENQDFIDDLANISQQYQNLGIMASDIQPGNLGYDAEGNLKAFDVENRQTAGEPVNADIDEFSPGQQPEAEPGETPISNIEGSLPTDDTIMIAGLGNDGTLYVGQQGDAHINLLDRFDVTPDEITMGFVDSEGNFMEEIGGKRSGFTMAQEEAAAGEQAEQSQQPTESTPYPNVSEDAQEFLDVVDATGVFPPQMTSKLTQLAEENGIEVDENTRPEDVIQQLREKGAGIEGTLIGRPVSPTNLRMADNVPYRKGLAIAGRDRETGRVYVGGASHSQLINQFEGELDIGRTEMGFYSEDGQFLTRDQATQYRNKQEEGAGDREAVGDSGLYFAESLEQSESEPNVDDIARGMLVQWNRDGQNQFDEPRRVRETETDPETGREYARVEGEPKWLPVSQLSTVDPAPTQSEQELQSQLQFASEIGDLSTELASNNFDEASSAAEVATVMALDNGVQSYPEFYAMTAESIDGKPNPQALRDGWEKAMADPANRNKQEINSGEGTLAQRFDDWTSGLSYQFLLQMYNENHPVTVMEKRLAEQYSEADRFTRENIDNSVNTFLKLMPGRMSYVWDRYLNPRNRYSKMGNIVRETVARDINMADWTRLTELYEQLAAANRAGLTDKAQEIENEIMELSKADELQQFLIAKHTLESNPYAQEKFSDEIEALQDQIATLEGKIPNLRGQRRKAAQDKRDALQSQLDSRRYPLGMTVDQANEILNEFRNTEGVSGDTKYDDLMEVGEKVWALENEYLENAVNIGVVTADARDRMQEVYSHHVPANRIITDENGNITGGLISSMTEGNPKIYERQGSDRMVGHILTNITHNFDKMMRYGMKNQMRVKTADIIREEVARGNTSLGQIKAEHELTLGEQEMAVPFREVQQRERPTNEGNVVEDIIQEKYIVFADPQMAEMYKDINSNPVSNSAFMSAVKAIMNLQHFTIIGGSLSFGASNQFRDVSDAMQNAVSELGYSDISKIPKEMLSGNRNADISNWKDFMKERVLPYHRAIVKYERTGETPTQAAQDYARLKELGGTTTFYRVRNQEAIMGDLQQIGQELQSLAEKKPSWDTIKATVGKLGNGIDYWNNMWENSTRTVLFRIALDSGMNETHAAEFALETMPNFNRIGKLGRKINNHFLFFNAAVQATASHGFAWQKGAAKTLTTSAAIAMTGYFSGMFNDLFEEDDDDSVSSTYEKDKRVNTWKYHRNLVMNNIGEDGDIDQFHIPIGYSTSVYWGIGGDLYDLQQGYIDQDEFQKRLATNLVDVYNPMSGADMFEDTQHSIYAMSPTWSKPAASIATNVVFGGRLYSDYKLAQPTTDDWQLYSPYTPKPLRYASEWLNKNDIADVSPKTLDLWYSWATNSAGKDITGFKELHDVMAKDEEFNADQFPILRRFYSDMNKAEVNYRSVWNRITQYNEDAPAAGTEQMERLLDNIEQEYGNVTESDVMPAYQIESLDGGIQTYVDFLHDQRRIQEAKEHFSSKGWDGKEYRDKRYQYYKRQNYISKEFPEANIRYEWKNGKFIKDFSKRRAYTMDVVKDIEGKFKTPGEDITFSTDS